ncbi:2-hydroxyacid dehydrogenase [Mangrovivirga cuniculi]|uniref:Hydroxyacid dehydrogenase n=1 Tax=Mangrovivirga cuniculi TaxID=2715131 RepID=A0A4D7JQ84_9BACT|nr:2-hydroxyacid dehydrogenase [Mangrovivirga cuniculi]QCK16903.1 hydroxyacid dehydrogenase [Mangrovivirga cuniculi]
MKTAVFSTKSYDREYLNRFNKSHSHELTYFEAPLNENTVNLTVGYDAVCVFVNDNLNKKVIDELSSNGVKVIALRCAGFNNVNLDQATKKKIAVVRVPTYSPQAVAEHAVALILTLNRKTHKAYNRIRESNFSLERLTGFDIYGKTVGVIGTGHIGALFAKIMLGFGCHVIGYDVKENQDLMDAGVKYYDLDELFEKSDVISLHCPLIPATHHLLDKEAFDKMKNGVMVINTSRGALINTSDAIAALKSGKLGYLGIDVYEQEEKLFFKDLSEEIIEDDEISRLMTFPNVLITSHQGFFTKEALEEIARTTLKNLTDLDQEKKPDNQING